MQNNVAGTINPWNAAQPYVRIIEQPTPKVRFRWKQQFREQRDGRARGLPIPGISSCSEKKTFPTIQLVGCSGPALVRVSLVTEDEPFRVHPCSLVKLKEYASDTCEVELLPGTTTVSFTNLGIQCVRRKDVEEALSIKQLTGVDPFQQGFQHKTQPETMEVNCVRLCFEVFLGEADDKNRLTPVVSEPLFHKTFWRDLRIVKMSEHECPADGGNKDIIMLCEKIRKDDIRIRFYEESDEEVVWEGFGVFQREQVHMQAAIWFRPPEYLTKDLKVPVHVNVQLVRPSDEAVSKPVNFRYIPRAYHLDHHPFVNSGEV